MISWNDLVIHRVRWITQPITTVDTTLNVGLRVIPELFRPICVARASLMSENPDDILEERIDDTLDGAEQLQSLIIRGVSDTSTIHTLNGR